MTAGMRYHSAEVADVATYIAADGWAMEQKLDGVRCIATVVDGETKLTGHAGAPLQSGVKHHGPLRLFLASLPIDATLDGELLADGHLWVFDLLAMGGHSTTSMSFAERRRLLVALFDAWDERRRPVVHLVDSFTDADAKSALWDRVLATGAEGVVVKRLAATYSTKSRSRDVLKIKVTKTIDVVVVGFGTETESAVLGLVRDGQVVEVGKCSLLGKARVALGDVIEVQYLYVVDPSSPRLYQGRMMRRRPDKQPTECGWDQLDGAFASKEVIAR